MKPLHKTIILLIFIDLGPQLEAAREGGFSTQVYLGMGYVNTNVKHDSDRSISEMCSKFYLKNALSTTDLAGRKLTILIRSTLQSFWNEESKNEFLQQCTFHGGQPVFSKGFLSYQADLKMRLLVRRAFQDGMLWDSDYYLINLSARYDKRFTRGFGASLDAKAAYTDTPEDRQNTNYCRKVGLTLNSRITRQVTVIGSAQYSLARYRRLVSSSDLMQRFLEEGARKQQDRLVTAQCEVDCRQGRTHFVAAYQLQENRSNSRVHEFHVQHATFSVDRALDRKADYFVLIRAGGRIKEFGNLEDYEQQQELEFDQSLAHKFLTVVLSKRLGPKIRVEADFTGWHFSTRSDHQEEFTRQRFLLGLRYKG